MSTLTMKPIQVYLAAEQVESLRSVAERRKVSIAERSEGVDRILADVPAEEDPLWNIIGIMDGGPSDLAENHDKYIAEMIVRRTANGA